MLYYSPMHRTQLYLDETHYQFLVQCARQRGKSLAHVVRDLIDERMRIPGKGRTKRDSFWKTIGSAAGDGARVAENYEDFLYGP